MTSIMRSARGAAAYASSGFSAFHPSDESSAFSPDLGDSFAEGWSRVIDELLRIRMLENDWDGEGSEAPDPSLVDGAIQFARILKTRRVSPPNHTHASVNSTVYFEWHTPLGYTEIEVISPSEVGCRSVQEGSVPTEEIFHFG